MTDDKQEDEYDYLKGNDHAVGNSGGAPKGNENAVGNPGGQPPENNQNAAVHHLQSDENKLLDWLEENEPGTYEWIMAKHSSYLQDAPFGADSAKSDRLLEACVCEHIIWKNRGVQVKDGIVTKTHIKGSDGSLVEVEDERPENLAINRMDRQVMSKLKTLGIFDDNSGSSGSGKQTMESDDYIITIENEAE